MLSAYKVNPLWWSALLSYRGYHMQGKVSDLNQRLKFPLLNEKNINNT